MAYYPKNKITTDLYTEEGNFMLLGTRQIYSGYYHKLYNGKYFTGKTPNEPNSKELILIAGETGKFSLSDENIYPVKSSPLLPTPQDYKNGEFTRYFIIKRNEPVFVEVSKKEYDKYKDKNPTVYWRLFKPVSLFWVLTGEINQVAKTNKNVTELVEQRERAFGLGVFLKENWTQYHKEKP